MNSEGKVSVSVIVPVYNAEKYLHDALNSLKEQSYINFEVIIVDDGSSDGSPEICREYCEEDPRFRMIRESNSGVSAARNRGVDESKGDWIAFLDADDMLMPDAIKVLMDAAGSSNCGVIVGKLQRGSYRKVDGSSAKESSISSEILQSRDAIISGLYQSRILNSPCGVLYDSRIFNDDKPLKFCLGRYEDLDFFYRAFERVGSICILDREVYFYRNTPGSFINSWSHSRLDALDVTDRMVLHFRGEDKGLLRAAEDRRFSAHCNILLEMLRYGVDLPEQKKRCISVIKELRISELLDRNVRIKNKVGALLSYIALPFLK